MDIPHKYTELFFLDEATALAAGHRPCAECQRERFVRFRAAGARANPRRAGGAHPPAPLLDAALHAERLTPAGHKRPYAAPAAGLPDGVFVRLPEDAHAYLVLGQHLLRWSPFGYQAAVPRPAGAVQVLTPRSVVNTLAGGFSAALHPSARKWLAGLITRQF